MAGTGGLPVNQPDVAHPDLGDGDGRVSHTPTKNSAFFGPPRLCSIRRDRALASRAMPSDSMGSLLSANEIRIPAGGGGWGRKRSPIATTTPSMSPYSYA